MSVWLKQRQAWLSAVTWIALVGLLMSFARRLSVPTPNYYGTAGAPNSDALGEWLYGALEFLFFKDFTSELLFRPHVGIFFSSIMTLLGRSDMIPAFLIGVLVAAVLLHAAAETDRIRLMLAALIAYFLARYGAVVVEVQVDSLNTDFMSLVLTLTALLLLGAGLRWRGPNRYALLAVGFLAAGIAGVIRGPFLFGGLAIGAVCLSRFRQEEVRWRSGIAYLTPLIILFFAPFVLDAWLLAGAGFSGSGMPTLYSVYTDPAHELTTAAHLEYRELKPSGGEVLGTYAQFIFSSAGLAFIAKTAIGRFGNDWLMAMGGGVAGALLVLCLGAIVLHAAADKRPTPRVVALGLIAAVLAIQTLFPGSVPYSVSTFVVAGASGAVGLWLRQSYAPVFAAFYLAGVMFLVMTGVAPHYPRIYLTVQFALVAAILAFICEDLPASPPRLPRTLLAGGIAMILLFLYGANFVLTSSLRDTYRQRVMGKPAAIKVSSDKGLDRSLWFSGQRDLLYTRYETSPVGTTVEYQSFEDPTGKSGAPGSFEGAWRSNALFEMPGRFVMAPETAATSQ